MFCEEESLILKQTFLNPLNIILDVLDLPRANSSSAELAEARLGCGTNFSFHISGFVVELTNPHGTEEPLSNSEKDQIYLHSSVSSCMVIALTVIH